MTSFSASIHKLEVEEAYFPNATTVKQAVIMLQGFTDWRLERFHLDFIVGTTACKLLVKLVKKGTEKLQTLTIKEAFCENKETSEQIMQVLSKCQNWQVEKLNLNALKNERVVFALSGSYTHKTWSELVSNNRPTKESVGLEWIDDWHWQILALVVTKDSIESLDIGEAHWAHSSTEKLIIKTLTNWKSWHYRLHKGCSKM